MRRWAAIAAGATLACGTGDPDPEAEAPQATGTTAASSSSESTDPDGAPMRDTDGFGTGYEGDGGWPLPPSPPGGGGGGGHCSVFEQDCPEGKRCSAVGYDWDYLAWTCTEVAEDPRARLRPCQIAGALLSGHDDCDVGLQCLTGDPAGEGAGRCIEFCSLECSGVGEICVPLSGGLLPICTKVCDPLEEAACEDKWACIDAAIGPPVTFVCAPRAFEATRGEFEGCDVGAQCQDGLYCAESGTQGECRKVCALADPKSCDAPMQCLPFDGPTVAPWEHLGECR